MSAIRIGISGWRYAPWRGVFYPRDLPQRCELWYASRILPTMEINGSFYSLQRPEYYARWYDETPDDFIFAVKAPRFITHVKRLRDVATPLAEFLRIRPVQSAREVRPRDSGSCRRIFRMTVRNWRTFLALLPRDTERSAAACTQARLAD